MSKVKHFTCVRNVLIENWPYAESTNRLVGYKFDSGHTCRCDRTAHTDGSKHEAHLEDVQVYQLKVNRKRSSTNGIALDIEGHLFLEKGKISSLSNNIHHGRDGHVSDR